MQRIILTQKRPQLFACLSGLLLPFRRQGYFVVGCVLVDSFVLVTFRLSMPDNDDKSRFSHATLTLARGVYREYSF